MARSSYMPSKGAEQVAWSNKFIQAVSGKAAEYGLPAAVVTQFDTLNTTLQAAWAAADDPATRTRGVVAAKDNALKSMRAAAKYAVTLIQGTASITDQMKIDAGVTVRKVKPSPRPVPVVAPTLVTSNATATGFGLELRASRTRRGKPAGATSALVFISTGVAAPQSMDQWQFYANTTTTTLDVTVPASATGQTVWVTAFWNSNRGESGPAATAVSTVLPAGGVLPSAKTETKMRIAKAA